MSLRKTYYRNFLLRAACCAALVLSHYIGFGQFIIGEGFSAQVLVGNVLVGDGVQTRNIKHTGHNRSMALFENGNAADLGLDKGIILSTGAAINAKGQNDDNGKDRGVKFNTPGDATLRKLVNNNTIDASVLEFEFKPQTEEIEFTYIFSSEEYLEFIDHGVNDVFGFFISGPGIVGEQNVAKIPGSNVAVSIDSVNNFRNSAYFIHNNSPSSVSFKNLQHDGQTVVLKANLSLQACKWYKIKLAITDVGDAEYDSWVFIGSKSFKHKTAIGNDTSFCSDGFVQTLDAGHPGRSVLWSNGERTQKIQVKGYGTYWVEVFTQCGSFKDEINILPAIRPISIGNDTMVCGNEVNQTLEVSNRVFDKYVWSNGDTTSSLTVTKPGKYWLEVTRDGCLASDTILIEDIPIPEFSLGNDTLICGEVDINLRANISADDFTWFDGSKVGIKKVTQPGVYWLRADKGVCHFIDTIEVTSRDEFEVDIGPPSLFYCESRDVRLSTQINDTNTFSIRWNTGSEVGAIIVNTSGFYSVLVRDKSCDFEATDGCDVTFVSEALAYFVPNAFSPNGDGLNETISPYFGLSYVEDYTFMIYNRWGQRVFETHQYGQSWDGMWKGKYAAPGVYMWYSSLKTECLPDNKRYQKGTITIMR